LPFFAEHTLSRIIISEVDRYRQEKVSEAASLTAAAEEGKARAAHRPETLQTSRLRPN
jgi:hypothetical protein